LVQSIGISRGILNNRRIARSLERVVQGVKRGEGIAGPLAKAGVEARTTHAPRIDGAARYQTVEQLVRDDPACSESNPLFQRIDQPGVGRVLAPGSPLRCSAFAPHAPRPAPRLGEHTEEVLLDVLRLDHAGYGRLVDRGIAAG